MLNPLGRLIKTSPFSRNRLGRVCLTGKLQPFSKQSLTGKFGSPVCIRLQQPQEQRYNIPIPTSVCGIFLCPDNGMAACVWVFKVRADVDACDCNCARGLYGHSLHRNLALGEKSLAASKNQTRVRTAPGLFCPTFY